MNPQISSPTAAVLQAVKPNQSSSTIGQSACPPSGNWLRLGDTWVVRPDHFILLADSVGPKVQGFLDIGMVIEIEVKPGGARTVIEKIRYGVHVPQQDIGRVSIEAI